MTFTNFASTNPSQLHPLVVVEETGVGEFSISFALSAPEFGDLVGVFVDLAAGVAAGDLSNLAFLSDDPVLLPGSDFSYEFSSAGIDAKTYSGGVCESNILSGGLPVPLFEGVACYRGTGKNKPTAGVNPVLMRVYDPDGQLALTDFKGIALRYKSSSNLAGSDKLFSSTTVNNNPPPPPPPSVVPLPAAGGLLLGALGLLALRNRRRKTA